MQTFNDAKEKNLENIASGAISTAGTVAQGMAQKANPTLTGSSASSGVPAAGTAVAPKTSSIPGVKVQNNAPSMIGNYDFDTDFQAMINDAVARGDYGAAAMFENLRNQKLGYMESPYSTSYIYNYNDPYRGQLERMQDDIMNREKFSYDYRDDEQYKAMKRMKEKEAQKAFNDAYGRLSTQFEGDIPVNMINKLYDIKADIIDQADSYIPQLQQLAYSMYMNEGDQMMRNYAMMQDEAAQDYNRWAADRNMAIAGADNAYGRGWNEKTYADDVAYRDKAFDRRVFTEDRAYNYAVGQDEKDRRTDIAAVLYNNGKSGISFEEAYKRAEQYV